MPNNYNYNYYRYYDMTKHLYKVRYEEKKRREEEEKKIPPNYYYDYWKYAKWKKKD